MALDYFFKHESGLILSNTGAPWMGSEDSGFRSALLAAAHDDIPMLVKCYQMIQEGRRWPVECDSMPHSRKNKLTRDPIIAFMFAAKLMHRKDLILTLKIPWFVYNLEFYFWIKYLKTGKESYRKKFEQINTLPKKAFARFLDGLKAYTVESEKMKSKILAKCPDWNLGLRALCGIIDPGAGDYKAQKGFLWQSEDYYDHKILPEGQTYYLDKDFLDLMIKQNA